MPGRCRSTIRCRPTDGSHNRIHPTIPENVMRKSVLATLLAGALLSLHAQATDLLQVYREALANDAQFASAQAALAAGEEKSVQGRSALLPTVAVSGNYGRTNYDADVGGTDVNRSFNANGYTLSLSQ